MTRVAWRLYINIFLYRACIGCKGGFPPYAMRRKEAKVATTKAAEVRAVSIAPLNGAGVRIEGEGEGEGGGGRGIEGGEEKRK